jgi:hypothetical protein
MAINPMAIGLKTPILNLKIMNLNHLYNPLVLDWMSLFGKRQMSNKVAKEGF